MQRPRRLLLPRKLPRQLLLLIPSPRANRSPRLDKPPPIHPPNPTPRSLPITVRQQPTPRTAPQTIAIAPGCAVESRPSHCPPTTTCPVTASLVRRPADPGALKRLLANPARPLRPPRPHRSFLQSQTRTDQNHAP